MNNDFLYTLLTTIGLVWGSICVWFIVSAMFLALLDKFKGDEDNE